MGGGEKLLISGFQVSDPFIRFIGIGLVAMADIQMNRAFFRDHIRSLAALDFPDIKLETAVVIRETSIMSSGVV